ALALAAALLAAAQARAQPPFVSALPTPRLFLVSPPGARAGSAVEVTCTGTDLDHAEALLFSHPGVRAELVGSITPPPPPGPKKPRPNPRRPGLGAPGLARFKVTVPADTPVGLLDVRLVNRWGVSNPRAFVVGDLPEAAEKEP